MWGVRIPYTWLGPCVDGADVSTHGLATASWSTCEHTRLGHCPDGADISLRLGLHADGADMSTRLSHCTNGAATDCWRRPSFSS